MPAHTPPMPKMPSGREMLESFLPMILIFGLQALKLDYTNPLILWGFRSAFLISFLANLFLIMKVKKAVESKEVELSKRTITYARPVTMSERTKNIGTPQADDTHVMETQTLFEYDSAQADALRQSTLTAFAISGGLHLYFGYMPPLLLQAILSGKRLFESPLVRLYVRGEPSSNPGLQRPFKAASANPFSAMLPDAMNPEKQAEEFARKHKAAAKKK